jgi:hypothetical protein
MVVGLDMGLARVKVLMEKASVRRFMSKSMKGESLCAWLNSAWMSLLGYLSMFCVLVIGWLCFVPKKVEVVELIMKQA